MRKPSPHQRFVLDLLFANENKLITKKEVCQNIFFYHNGEKYVGEILSRMVNQGMLKRIKPGVFQIGSGLKKMQEADKNQVNLF